MNHNAMLMTVATGEAGNKNAPELRTLGTLVAFATDQPTTEYSTEQSTCQIVAMRPFSLGDNSRGRGQQRSRRVFAQVARQRNLRQIIARQFERTLAP